MTGMTGSQLATELEFYEFIDSACNQILTEMTAGVAHSHISVNKSLYGSLLEAKSAEYRRGLRPALLGLPVLMIDENTDPKYRTRDYLVHPAVQADEGV